MFTCRLQPEEVVNGEKQLYITQPGSSVATSLCEAESREKKVNSIFPGVLNLYRWTFDLLKVGLLVIKGKEFKIEPIPLQTVRPMIFKTINIEDTSIDFTGEEREVQMRIETYLKDQVYILYDIPHLVNLFRIYQVEEILNTEIDSKLTGHPKQPELPLLRIRIEYTDETHQLAPGRFGNNFHDR